jgi:hypothetical protein
MASYPLNHSGYMHACPSVLSSHATVLLSVPPLSQQIGSRPIQSAVLDRTSLFEDLPSQLVGPYSEDKRGRVRAARGRGLGDGVQTAHGS